MSLNQLKKQAKNLHRHLPDFLSANRTEISLSACQELVAKMNGYPSFHAATKSAEAKEAKNQTPVDDDSTRIMEIACENQGGGKKKGLIPFSFDASFGTQDSIAISGWLVDAGINRSQGVCVAVIDSRDDDLKSGLIETNELLRKSIVEKIREHKRREVPHFALYSMIICTADCRGIAYRGEGLCEISDIRTIPEVSMRQIMKRIDEIAKEGHLSAYERYVLRRTSMRNSIGIFSGDLWSEDHFNKMMNWARESVVAYGNGKSIEMTVKLNYLEHDLLDSVRDCSRFEPSLKIFLKKQTDTGYHGDEDGDLAVRVKCEIKKKKKKDLLKQINEKLEKMI